MKKYLSLIAVAFMLVLSASTFAQTSAAVQAIAPMTRDLGALKTYTAATVTTTTVSADQNGFNVSRVICAFRMVTSTTNPSMTFSIQNYDAASKTYYTLITSAAITSATTVTTPLAAGSGVATAANLGIGIPIAKTWRVMTSGTGSGTVTGTIGCSVQ